ncbi:DoxX-like family protein [Paranoxybacillus vitaminiphilus]|nr:DoxX-like family protein [Anoxybacillus vitaminiphilus]
MGKSSSIYVETIVKTDMETLWEYTQNPELHEQWDLRFSTIKYLPKKHESEAQRFLYTTKIGFGLSISGEGEAVGTRIHNGERTSSLKFWSDQPISLIKKGSGYWKYTPHKEGIRFYTIYHYETRFGFMGKVFDRWMFRPIMAWATAWSFDCLRLWIEKKIHPLYSVQRSLIHLLVVFTLVLIWIYQGLVPKLLFPDSGELEMIKDLQLFAGYESFLLSFIGFSEILFGIFLFLFRRTKWIYYWNIGIILFLTLGAFASDPTVFREPFNPVTLNVSVIILSFIGLITLRDTASASNCKWGIK